MPKHHKVLGQRMGLNVPHYKDQHLLCQHKQAKLKLFPHNYVNIFCQLKGLGAISLIWQLYGCNPDQTMISEDICGFSLGR